MTDEHGLGILILVIIYCCYEISCHGATGNGNGGLSRDVSTALPADLAEMFLNMIGSGNDTEQGNFIISSGNDKNTSVIQKNCMSVRSQEFSRCADKVGENSMKHFETRNLTEMLTDLCSPDVSKPYVECLLKHFRACPEFLTTIEVQLLQFGPLDIKDVVYFRSVDHMCDCSRSLACVKNFYKIRSSPTFTSTFLESPLVKVPDYKTICEERDPFSKYLDRDPMYAAMGQFNVPTLQQETKHKSGNGKYIDCMRKNLRKCKSALTQQSQGNFTLEHAEEVKRMYDFRREHCNTVTSSDFDDKYKCVEILTTTKAYKHCLTNSVNGSPSEQLCGMRNCLHQAVDNICDSTMIAVYIDAVNIFRHGQLRFLNFPCSSAADTGFSIFTVLAAFLAVSIF